MDHKSTIIAQFSWHGTINNYEQKQKVARQIAAKVSDGGIIGVGSGSTSYLALAAIAQRVRDEQLHVKAIPTSIEMELACRHLGISVTSLYKHRPDWYFDGADEVDPQMQLIKGRGGAMFKEKLIMSASPRNYILVDQTKLVDRLGQGYPVPVEVFPPALIVVEARLMELGARLVLLRPAQGKDGPVITENGNLILDAWFDAIGNELEFGIKCITGVIESGLFQNAKAELLVAK